MSILNIQYLEPAVAVAFTSGGRANWLANKIKQYADADGEQLMIIGFDYGDQAEKENPDFGWCIKEGDQIRINGGLIWHGDHYGSHT